jgi:hypothetical protein
MKFLCYLNSHENILVNLLCLLYNQSGKDPLDPSFKKIIIIKIKMVFGTRGAWAIYIH